ncbi:hypothetical protein E3J79_02010 [Candidatus Dependentiae bacterium]|nr:MAG: hypothetical protein E3J79_02010 [Candidatus Dependentiae bacterium]
MEPQTNHKLWIAPTPPDFIYETQWATQIARRVISYNINNEQVATALSLVPKDPEDNPIPILGEISLQEFDFYNSKYLKIRDFAKSIFLYLQDSGFHQVAVNIFTLEKLAKLRLCNPDDCKEIDKSATIILSLLGNNKIYPTQISCIINHTNNQL